MPGTGVPPQGDGWSPRCHQAPAAGPTPRGDLRGTAQRQLHPGTPQPSGARPRDPLTSSN